jgi:hypothetical protein
LSLLPTFSPFSCLGGTGWVTHTSARQEMIQGSAGGVVGGGAGGHGEVVNTFNGPVIKRAIRRGMFHFLSFLPYWF